VLTLRCATTIFRSAALSVPLAACATITVTLCVFAPHPAHADGMMIGSCVGSRFSVSCVRYFGSYGDPYVRLVRPASEAEKARSADRDHKWQTRCRPAVFQDHYGVPRYEYAAPGCEFGVVE
jgi:hypothetical protein